MRGSSVLFIAAFLLISSREACHDSDRMVIQEAAEDSLRLKAYYSCKKALPDLKLEPREEVFRAPGRYQVIRRRQQDQIACITWEGEVQYIDTALIQPGNGVITP